MYCIYLRKSRADLEAEARGEGDTLKRHKQTLLALARKKSLNIGEIYQELVSGESIAARSEMQRLLHDVEDGKWEGVLVMEIERLARGSTIDQGIIAQTFKSSNTKIITPVKDYDPNNEFDEEYFEFGLFMSRREYKTIRRRMEAGRAAASREGKYIGSIPPYGYDVQRTTDGYVLFPNEAEAPILRNIFDWYVNGEELPDGSRRRLGVSLIARKLNEMHIPTRRGGVWVTASLRDMVKNPVYIGKIKWKGVISDGLHEPLVSTDIFNRAQEIIRLHAVPAPDRTVLKNPLAGLIVCGKCGRKMVRRPYQNRQEPSLVCTCNACDNVSSDFSLVESRVLVELQKLYDRLTVNPDIENPSTENEERLIKQYDSTIADCNKRRDSLYDLLERGVYSDEVFLERQAAIGKQLSDAIEGRSKAMTALEQKALYTRTVTDYIPLLCSVLENYGQYATAQKNSVLKEVLDKIVYVRETGGRWKDQGNFTLELYPKYTRES